MGQMRAEMERWRRSRWCLGGLGGMTGGGGVPGGGLWRYGGNRSAGRLGGGMGGCGGGNIMGWLGGVAAAR